MDLTNYRTDAAKKQEGVWIPFFENSQVKIAHFENEEFKAAYRRETAVFTRTKRDATPDEASEIMIKLMARHIILDWKGIKDGGEDLPFSIEAAENLLREVDAARERLVNEAKDWSNFRKKADEELEGN